MFIKYCAKSSKFVHLNFFLICCLLILNNVGKSVYYELHGVLWTYLFLYIWIDNIASYQGAYCFLDIALLAPNVYDKNFLLFCSCFILVKVEKKVCSELDGLVLSTYTFYNIWINNAASYQGDCLLNIALKAPNLYI